MSLDSARFATFLARYGYLLGSDRYCTGMSHPTPAVSASQIVIIGGPKFGISRNVTDLATLLKTPAVAKVQPDGKTIRSYSGPVMPLTTWLGDMADRPGQRVVIGGHLETFDLLKQIPPVDLIVIFMTVHHHQSWSRALGAWAISNPDDPFPITREAFKAAQRQRSGHQRGESYRCSYRVTSRLTSRIWAWSISRPGSFLLT